MTECSVCADSALLGHVCGSEDTRAECHSGYLTGEKSPAGLSLLLASFAHLIQRMIDLLQ